MHYIRLLTTNELSDDEMANWFDTVIKFAPAGAVIVDIDDWATEADEEVDLEVDQEEDYGDPDFPYVYVADLLKLPQGDSAL